MLEKTQQKTKKMNDVSMRSPKVTQFFSFRWKNSFGAKKIKRMLGASRSCLPSSEARKLAQLLIVLFVLSLGWFCHFCRLLVGWFCCLDCWLAGRFCELVLLGGVFGDFLCRCFWFLLVGILLLVFQVFVGLGFAAWFCWYLVA